MNRYEFSDMLLILLCQITMVTHPHPNPPLEGEGIFSLLHLQGGGREGDGVRKRNAMLKCDKVELTFAI
jgi:hypothetical protein